MLTIDNRARIVAVNRAFTRLSGYSAGQLIGKTPFLMKSRRHDKEFYETLWAELTSTNRWSGEIWARHGNGRICATEVQIAGIVDWENKATFYTGVVNDITARKRTEDRTRQTAHTDPLTGLPDSTLFHDRLGRLCSYFRRDKRPAAVILINIDDFRAINDNFGFDAGDELLREMGLRIKRSIRDSDTVTRLEGDEFAVILSDINDPRAGELVAGKLRTRLSDTYELGYHHRAFISIRLGLATLPADGSESDVLVKRAGMALHQAKTARGNTSPSTITAPF